MLDTGLGLVSASSFVLAIKMYITFWAASRHGLRLVFQSLLISRGVKRMPKELAELLDTAVYKEVNKSEEVSE